ncbi:hypothetical protein D6D20_03460 [Aureobasidium pullulans]|uniref:Uncharacterized protein n=1 Tax=Aureobasidium pullulans TaxID=5580 RepID=A0A4S8ZDH6_AURPU|nr:hypothetical protein D6D20_03460 [Aureobasidium pullulans]TIA01897.1 hypothetical protein D6C82_03297 [Aureobasidium pullulans]
MKLTWLPWLFAIIAAALVVAKPLDRDPTALTTLVTRSINTATVNPIAAKPLTSRSVAAALAKGPCESAGTITKCALKATIGGWPWKWKKNFKKCIMKCMKKHKEAYPILPPNGAPPIMPPPNQPPLNQPPPNEPPPNDEPVSENDRLRQENERLEEENRNISDEKLEKDKDKLEREKLEKEHDKLQDENRQLLNETNPSKEFDLIWDETKMSSVSASAASVGSALASAAAASAAAASAAAADVPAADVSAAATTDGAVQSTPAVPSSSPITGDFEDLMVIAQHSIKASAAIQSAAAATAVAANPHPNGKNINDRRALSVGSPALTSRPRASATTQARETGGVVTSKASKTRASLIPTDPFCERVGLDCIPRVDTGEPPATLS